MLNKKIIQDTKKLVEELCLLLQSLHPVETLKRAYWECIYQHLGTKTESEIGTEAVHSSFLLEYLQSLFISIDLKEDLRPPTDEKEWKNIKEKASRIYENCRSPFIINQDDNTISPEDKLLFYRFLTSWMQIRGNRYSIHEYEHLNNLLTPHNEILKELYHVTVEDILDGFKKIYQIVIFSPKVLKDSYKAKKEFNHFYDDLKKKPLSNKDIEKLLQDKIVELQLEDKVAKENLNIQKITGWPEVFIKKFSASVGNHKNFLKKGGYSGTPLQLLPIVKKPFLKYGANFYLFCPSIFYDHFYRNIQSAVLEDKPNYKETWNKKQTTVSEEIPFNILKKIIGPSEQIKNFHYKIKGYKGNESWFECDGIILCEQWLFVVEVKSGKISYQSPAENIDSHFKSIKKLLTEPAKQGRRFIEALKQEKTLKLYDEKKGKLINTVCIDDFKKNIVFAISLEQLTDISPKVQQFETLNLESQGEPVLCISIDDLRTYRDLFNGTIEFYHFLTERSKAFYNKRLTLDDELDHFGLYLECNQYHDITETKKFKKASAIFFGGMRDEIDLYFNTLYFEPEKAVRPKQNLPPILEGIIKNLELSRKPGFTQVGIDIYSLSGETRSKMSKYILDIISLQNQQKKIRPACFLWETPHGDLSVSLIIRMPNIQPDFILKDYAVKNMFIQETEKSLLLDYFGR